MKYAILLALLGILGALLLVYATTQMELLDWARLEEGISDRQITTQSGLEVYVKDLYRSGQLPDYLKPPATVAVAAAVLMLVTGIVSTVHILIDKFFYCKFYEQPNVLLAIRRGGFWGIFFVVVLALGVANFWSLGLLALVGFVAICIEVLLNSLFIGKRKVENTKP